MSFAILLDSEPLGRYFLICSEILAAKQPNMNAFSRIARTNCKPFPIVALLLTLPPLPTFPFILSLTLIHQLPAQLLLLFLQLRLMAVF